MSALLSFPGVSDIPDQEGRTALMWAAQRGNHSVLKAMLEREVDVHAADTLGSPKMQLISVKSSLLLFCCVLSTLIRHTV